MKDTKDQMEKRSQDAKEKPKDRAVLRTDKDEGRRTLT